jgi:hypothetical protein
MVAALADRESDIYTEWATLPGENFHLLTRSMQDRGVAGGGALSSAMAKLPFMATRTIDLLATHKRAARQAAPSPRLGAVERLRPRAAGRRGH